MKLVIDIPGKTKKSRQEIILQAIIRSEIDRLFYLFRKEEGVLFFIDSQYFSDWEGIAKYKMNNKTIRYGLISTRSDYFEINCVGINEGLLPLTDICDFKKTDLKVDKKRESRILYKPK